MATVTRTPGAAARTLSKDEIQRYSRHLIMHEVGMEGQLKLAQAKVLMIGAGGLGAPLGLYLAAAGVGRLGIVDFDVVDITNLQRQVTFSSSDVGRPKLDAAKDRLAGLNPKIQIDTYPTRLTSENALDLFKDYDIIVDGTDNFPTRFLVNDACVLLNKPNVYGSIFRFEGQATVFNYPGGPCYRCLFIPNRPRPAWCLPAPKAACSACCPESSALFKPWRPSSSSSAKASRWLAACCFSTRWPCISASCVCARIPTAPFAAPIPPLPSSSITHSPRHPWRGDPCRHQRHFRNYRARAKARLDRGDDLYILDVREPHEYQICNLNGHLIPLGEAHPPRQRASTVRAKSSPTAAAESARPTPCNF